MNLEIINILDKSGSMFDLRTDVIGGYNGFMQGQRVLPGYVRATLVQFNDRVETLYESVNILHLGALTQDNYAPIGNTALYDALGATLTRQGQRIARDGWAEKVIVNIVTDGAENASREYTLAQVKAMIQDYQDAKGWTFLFQAANIDAFKTGESFGISGATTRSYTASAAGMAEAYSTMATVATELRTGTGS